MNDKTCMDDETSNMDGKTSCKKDKICMDDKTSGMDDKTSR